MAELIGNSTASLRTKIAWVIDPDVASGDCYPHHNITAFRKADAILALLPGWKDIKDAPRDETVDLWAQERPRYHHLRITDCVYRDGKWKHPQTTYDNDELADAAGMVEIFNPTHFRLRPNPPEPDND